MKKLLFLFFLLLPAFSMAQDVIVKKDGSTIVSKVLEITSTEVKYKKYNNLNGPTYTIPKNELQGINYENGTKESFVGVTTKSESTGLSFSNNPQTSDESLLAMAGLLKGNERQRAKRLKIVGLTVGPAAIVTGVILVGAGVGGGDGDAMWIPGIILGAGGIATMVGCLVRAKKLKNESIYSIHSVPLYQHDFIFNNGTSLSTGVDVLKDNRINSQTIGVGLRYNF